MGEIQSPCVVNILATKTLTSQYTDGSAPLGAGRGRVCPDPLRVRLVIRRIQASAFYIIDVVVICAVVPLALIERAHAFDIVSVLIVVSKDMLSAPPLFVIWLFTIIVFIVFVIRMIGADAFPINA